jgi:phosphopantothenoylcysteine synthetase/decarboxylase
MTIVLTCGPAWEPIDGMRRLTNASTGALGARLADAWTIVGHRVLVFRGSGATADKPTRAAGLLAFDTNKDLANKLEALSRRERVDAVMHAAALCDFKVAAVRAADGSAPGTAKIPSRAGRITIELEPAMKVLPRLREWFPTAQLVGWKYELAGSREDSLAAAWRQLAEAGTDACVLNGAAWGPGFGLCEPPDRVTPCEGGAAELAELLLDWLRRRIGQERA